MQKEEDDDNTTICTCKQPLDNGEQHKGACKITMKDFFARCHSSIPIFSFPMPTICPFPLFSFSLLSKLHFHKLLSLTLKERRKNEKCNIAYVIMCFVHLFV
jgi:hypothetical protein